MRKKIVDQICRGALPEHAARARAVVQGHGNLIEDLVEVGFAPDKVLETCAAVTGIPLAPVHWLKSPKAPHVELDSVLCRAVGAAPVASMAGRLCIAYGDVEMAAQHASLGLPPHQPYLALRAQLEKALAMLPKDDAAETRIATAESVRPARRSSASDDDGSFEGVRTQAGDGSLRSQSSPPSTRAPPARVATSPRAPVTSDLDDPTEAVTAEPPPPRAKKARDDEARAQKQRASAAAAAAAAAADADATYDSPVEHDSEAAADDLLGDDDDDERRPPARRDAFAPGTPLPAPSAPAPSAGMIGADEPWRRPPSSDPSARSARAPGAQGAKGEVPVVPIAAAPPPSFGAGNAARSGEQSERTRRPSMQVVPVVPVVPMGASAFDAVLPPGVTPAGPESSQPTRRPDGPSKSREPSQPTRRPGFDDDAGAFATPATMPPTPMRVESSQPTRRPAVEVSPAPEEVVARRGSGFSIERSRPMPRQMPESLDPPVAPENAGGYASATKDESSGPSALAEEEQLFVDAAAAVDVAPAVAASSMRRLVPIVVVSLAVGVAGVVVAVQGPSFSVAAGDATRPPPPLVSVTPRPVSMDGKVMEDLPTRQAELIGKGQQEADHKKAIALFDQAIRLSPSAPGSRTALLEKARRLLLVGQAGLAQDAVMQLKRRGDVEPIEEQIERLLDDIQEQRQNQKK